MAKFVGGKFRHGLLEKSLRNTANGIFQRKSLWISTLGVAEITSKPCDLRGKMQIPPSQEWRKFSQNPEIRSGAECTISLQ